MSVLVENVDDNIDELSLLIDNFGEDYTCIHTHKWHFVVVSFLSMDHS